jgi:hypothetical protein
VKNKRVLNQWHDPIKRSSKRTLAVTMLLAWKTVDFSFSISSTSFHWKVRADKEFEKNSNFSRFLWLLPMKTLFFFKLVDIVRLLEIEREKSTRKTQILLFFLFSFYKFCFLFFRKRNCGFFIDLLNIDKWWFINSQQTVLINLVVRKIIFMY